MNLKPLGITIIVITVLVLISIAISDLKPQTIFMFEAQQVEFNDLEISDARVSFYQDLKLRAEFENNVLDASSEGGGIIFKGKLRNTSHRELFLPVFNMENSLKGGTMLMTLFVDDLPNEYQTVLWMHNTRLERNASEFAGYRLTPNEKVAFELVIPGIKLTKSDDFTLEIGWSVMDADAVDIRQENPILNFTPSGSTSAWFRKQVNWNFQPALYRTR